MTMHTGDHIVSLEDLIVAVAQLDRFGAQVALAAAQLNASGDWAVDGALSMTSWLEQHAHMSHRDAFALLRDGKFLLAHRAVAVAAVDGLLSASQVAALRAVVRKPTADLFDEHADAVIDAVKDLTVRDTEIAAQEWRDRAEAVVDMPEPKVPDRSWSTSKLEDGTVVGRFVFDPTAAAELGAAIETAHDWDGPQDIRTPGMRSADAMVAILAFFNANHDSTATRRHYPHVELNVHPKPRGAPPDGCPGDTAFEDPLLGGCSITTDGILLPSWVTDAYLCDCVIHRVMRAGAAVLDYGREVHTVPKALWAAVAARDTGCRFPGCHRPKAWCDAHHIQWWRRHGETKLDNLLLLCNRHHHLIHKQNWTVALDSDTAIVTFTTPDGHVLISRPRGTPTIRAA